MIWKRNKYIWVSKGVGRELVGGGGSFRGYEKGGFDLECFLILMERTIIIGDEGEDRELGFFCLKNFLGYLVSKLLGWVEVSND